MPDFRITLSRGSNDRDVTPRVLELRWRAGMADAYDSVARPAAGEILLDNRDGAASPALDVDGLYAPGVRVLIECDADGWQPLFTGAVAYARPDMGEYGARRTTLVVEGPDAALSRVIVRTPVLADVRADEVLGAVLDTPPLHLIPRDLAQGASTFVYVGDRWGAGLTAAAAVRQLVDAERGRFYTTRAGVLAFLNRDFALSAPSPAATFDAVADAATMTYGAQVVNRVRIHLRPRELGAAGTTLWTLANAQRLRPGAQFRLLAPLRDAQGRRAGALSIVTPVAGTDYSANTAPDGSGSSATAQVAITVIALEGSAAVVQIANAGTNTVYLMPGARLRGTPLVGGQPAAVEAADDANVATYGAFTLDLHLPLIDSIEAAHDLAERELAVRAGPLDAVRTLSLGDRTRYADALALTLFDRIRVLDPHTGHDRDYWIVGEAHHVTHGGLRHAVTFTLEPVAPDA